MPQVIYTEPGDEIVDLVERVRSSADGEVALVVNPGTAGFQTPLNVRLLRQLAAGADKATAIISGDPRIQELAKSGGFPTYASVAAFERGIQTVRPHFDEGLGGYPGGGTAVATRPAAVPVLAPPGPPPPSSAAAAVAAQFGREGIHSRRRPLYFAAIGLAVIGLLLLLLVAPSAKVTVTVAGTPLNVNPTIQGSTDPTTAGQPDHIVTAVVTSEQSSQFQAKPSGQKQVAPAPANASLTFSSRYVSATSYTLVVSQGDRFDTAATPPIEFTSTHDVTVVFPPNTSGAVQPGSPSVPVQALAPGTAGNVAAAGITQFPAGSDPCSDPSNPYHCHPGDFTFSNAQAATGGADPSTVTVASSQDVNGWNAQVTQSEHSLTAQANQDLQQKAAGKTLAKDPGGNGVTVACDVTPPLPSANDQFSPTQIMVACHGKAAAYNPSDINADARADLQQQVAQGDTLATDSITCSKPAITQASDDGTVVLSVQCTSFARPSIDVEGLKKQLTGHGPGEARNIIQHRLDHVQDVTVSQSPFPLFWLPFFASRIEIDETFVSQKGS